MTRPVNLCIVINNKTLFIPFNSLEEIDIFTTRYPDRYNFLINIIKILDLDITIKDITSIYIESSNRKNLPIKYQKDNYNLDSLINNYALYLIKDPTKITSGMKKVIANIKDNQEPNNLTLGEMTFIVKRYITSRYSIHRNIYFMIKDETNIAIDKPQSNQRTLKREDLSKLESNNDFIQYLIELKQRGYEELAIEELSKIDLEDLSSNLKTNGYGVFDGMCNTDLSIYEDMIILEESTGMDIDTLKEICYEQMNNGRKKWNIY